MGKSDWKDMREFIEFCETRGEVKRIKQEIDPEWEVNGITRIVCQNLGPLLIFENIKGADYPLVTNLIASDSRFLWSLGIEKWSEFNDEWMKRTEKLIPPVMVTSAPCQEETIQGPDIDIGKICNVKWHKLDKSPFPGTLSISVTKDPDTGEQNAGIYRMELQGKDQLGWGAPEYTHGRQHYMKYEQLNRPMPMAVVTGVDPVIEIVAATRTPPGIDEFHLAGALRRSPVEMVKCKTIDIEVPATAEWVFEGFINPGARHLEGTEWFGEYTGHYGEARVLPFFEVKLITHRKSPLYHGTREQWYPSESFFANGRTSQAEAYKTIKRLVPGIIDMRCNVCYEAIVKIKKLFKGHPQQVIDAVWGATYGRYKHVIIVDEDIDIWDYESVHWALSTRVKADRDVTIVTRRAGQWLDPALPLRERGWQTAMGIDATKPTEEYEFWGDQIPETVDDPDIVSRTKQKWGESLERLK
ncbi:MAG: UbiD family decarboxylase [Deltaproteobacteria bacterium]|nr:UbiD family decarboxylase [Deltaproteobacteria bacterium]